MKQLHVFILVIIFCFKYPSLTSALETDTHKAINKYITTNTLNGFSLDYYLKNQLGFTKGIYEEFTLDKTKQAWEWVQFGGLYEDIPYSWMPYVRSVNHFHNPLTDQGFSGIWGTGFLYGLSSIQWSQWPLGAQTMQVLGSGNYSWYDVRDYYYRALTSSDKTARDNNYTETFRGLGQVMHLVQDMSVPEHTRDDGHYIFYNYEKWVKTNVEGRISQYTPFVFFDSSAIGNPNPIASVPVANLFDTNQYNNPNPDPDVTANLTIDLNGHRLSNIGLSEYTNANFLSPDSEFTSGFPYPNLGSVVEHDETIAEKKRTYIRKLGQGEIDGDKIGNGEHIEHLALTGWLYKRLPADLKKRALRPVYSEYAQKLIPRAVGYSAGLLDYFFRGKINIIQIGADKFQIVNLSDEGMEGNLSSFKLFYDDVNDSRTEIPLLFYDASNNQYTDPNMVLLIPAQTKSTFTVKLNSSPQSPKTPGDYMLVFKGKLGNEGAAPYDTSYAVAAQMITPHFLAHAEVNGQWDIYEYDLLGNRIYNVTGGLPRGISYHHALPNPINPDLVVFSSDTVCSGNDPELQVCVRILTRSTGALELAKWIRIPWWSKDGQRVYGVDGGYYDLTTGFFESNSPWNAIDDPSFCGYGYFVSPSLSHDESMLAIEGNNPFYNPSRVDAIIFTPNGQSVNASSIVDMNTMTLAITDNQSICSNYIDDEIFFDTSPDFHPVENRIVFSSNESGPYEIYETDFTTRVIQQLTTTSAGDAGYYQPTWSPDGQEILFVGDKQGTLPEIYSIPSTGGTPVQITNDGVKHYYPRWMRYLGQ